MGRTGLSTLVGSLVHFATLLFNPALASVTVENSVTLTREFLSLPAGSLASYEYRIEAESELVFNVRLGRWRRQSLRMWLVDADNYARLNSGSSFDYIAAGTGVVRREAQIAVEIAEGGTYHVILDNSAVSSIREIEVYAFARRETPDELDDRVREFYERHYASLSRLLDIDGIDIQVRRCGRVNAYSIGSTVVICREMDALLATFAEPGVRLFILLHEFAHSLINQWGYRSIVRDQYLADRLASTLFALLDDDGMLESTAQWFAGGFASANDVLAQEFEIKESRGRRIARWLRERGHLDRSWTRRIVVSRFRDEALQKLANRQFLNPAASRVIAEEIAIRRSALRD